MALATGGGRLGLVVVGRSDDEIVANLKEINVQ